MPVPLQKTKMIWRIDVLPKQKTPVRDILYQIRDLGIGNDCSVYSHKIYFIDGAINERDVHTIASALLIDPVLETYQVSQGILNKALDDNEIMVMYNAGVSDPVAVSFEKAIGDLGIEGVDVRIARFYSFENLDKREIGVLAPRVLFNPLIEHAVEYSKVKSLKALNEFAGKEYVFDLITVDMLNADEKKLIELSRQGCLSLSIDEMKIIQDYFRDRKRNPTDCELETIATLWSEHCAHKTFRGVIDYEVKDAHGTVIKKETINNLLKNTVMKATKEINSPDCVSVFHDNSGVVRFDEEFNVCFKVETHNHPSSLEPYGGASTGIGGVIRDILGTGSGAKPFASIDVFCFSPWDIAYKDLPQGLLHPKRIIKGVVRGVRDYGNRMGIPTVAGAVFFDKRFLGNPLVYCGTLGIIPHEKSFKEVETGDCIIVCGAKTGRDGIHGATFSSKELDEQTVGLTSAVQIGNAIEEKKLTDALLRARDHNLFKAITDCGAGGIASAITELAGEHGALVNLEKMPLKYKGLSYTEIWISESQERMVFFAQEKDLPELKRIFIEEDVDLTVVGNVTDTKKLVLRYENNTVCDIDMDFIFNLPQLKKKAVWVHKKENDCKIDDKKNYNKSLKTLLSSLNVACKDWVLREYDHEVQAASVLKSMYGIEKISASDAAVLRPDFKNKKCIAVGVGINPFYSDIDPYWMAAAAIDEALRNVTCVGGNLEKTYILDNFCWGSPLDEEILGSLVRASQACYDFSRYFGVPFISGKDSLYNEYAVAGKRISIPGTLLISALSIISDWEKVISSHFKKEGNLIYLIGLTKPELGASEYFRSNDIKGGCVPKVDQKIAKDIFQRVSALIDKQVVCACHDVSEGGIAVTVAEMCMGSDRGAGIFLAEVAGDKDMYVYEKLFSESLSRFIVEVPQNKKTAFEQECNGVPFGLIGCVSKDKNLVVYDDKGQEVINLDIANMRDAWMKTFKEFRS